MDIVLVLHSWVRWLIFLVGVVAVAKFALGWAQKAGVAKMDRALMSAFSGLIDLQALLGFVLLLMAGDFSMPRIEHLVTMIVAAVVAHLPMRWRNDTGTNALRNNLVTVVAVFVVVVIGIGVLPGLRWTFKF